MKFWDWCAVVIGLALLVWMLMSILNVVSAETFSISHDPVSTVAEESVQFVYNSIDEDGEWLDGANRLPMLFDHAERRRNILNSNVSCWIYVISVSEDMAEIGSVDLKVASAEAGILFGTTWQLQETFKDAMLNANCHT